MVTDVSTLQDFINATSRESVKLHLGCGGTRWKDFINVDLYPHDESVQDLSRVGCVADVLADMRDLRLTDSAVDEIFTSHTLEHFTRWEALDMLRDWHRILRPGGKLVMETPDFNRCVLWLFNTSKRKRALAKSQFYGNQTDRLDFETHRYVWTPSEITTALQEIGYCNVTVGHRTETHYSKRDMRVEARKQMSG